MNATPLPQTAVATPLATARREGELRLSGFALSAPTEGTEVIETAVMAVVLALGPDVVDKAAELPARQEQYRECVAERESNGNPQARNRTSSASGKYQFLQTSWGHGLPYMVAEQLRDAGAPADLARQVRVELQETPIHKWPEELQDVAFAAVLNANGPWSGAKHWTLQGSACGRWIS